jgi:hypothetical protein
MPKLGKRREQGFGYEMKRFVGLGIALVAVIAAVLAGVTWTGGSSTSAASAASPQQQIGMKVLLITSSTDDTTGDGAAFVDWENTLNREGVPYDTVVTSSQGLPALSSTSGGTEVANYQGVIVAGSGTEGLSTAQWTTLQTFEQHFSVRQLTANAVPSADYGLQAPANGGDSLLPTTTALTLTTDGHAVFPYLKSVALDSSYPTYGAESAPSATPGGTVDTLISGPGASSMVGIFTTPDGRQTMYQTFNMGPGYLQSELLRHGELAWLTRGAYLGYQRNYLETNIDDNFLSDDTWDTTTHSTDYDPADALRESAADVANAANWETSNGYDNSFRIDMLFNGGGSQEYSDDNGTDPLIAAFKADKSSFGFINHTWDHPNLDESCANQAYIQSEISENSTWAQNTLGLTSNTSATASPLGTENPDVLVTGEHSGLANLIPGNPGTVDPPEFDAVTPAAGTSSLAAGSYIYAITDDFSAGGGQSSASESTVILAAGDTVSISWDAVCHAADYYVYRQDPGATSWTLVETVPAQAGQFGSTGPMTYTISDPVTGGDAATSTVPSTTDNAAKESPYAQNTYLDAAFKAVGITDFGSDASKPYPSSPDTGSTTPDVSAGSTFTEPLSGAHAIPRYPTNIYYNASTEAQEVDEFNTLYLENSDGTCLAITDCQTSAWTWPQILDDVTGIGGPYVGMFQHMMGNDPRPDYFHQTNMMGTPPASGTSNTPTVGDGLYYSVMDQLLAYYDSYFDTSGDAGSAPIEQPTTAEIGVLLDEQNAWNGGNVAGVSGSIEGSTVSVTDTGAVDVPLTGTTDGQSYAGDTSEWVPKFTGTKTFTATTAWPEPPTTPVIITVPNGPAPTLGGGTTQKSGPGATKKIVKKAIYYHAVQVAPKTVKINKHGKVMVSLKCVASRGKTKKGKVCKGAFTLKVAGRKMHHAFKIKSTKVDRIAVKLPKVARAATSQSKHHRITGTLRIATKRSHGKPRVARGKLTIRR